MKYKKREILKANHIMRFIKHLPQCTKKEFDKLCKKKEIRLERL